MADEMTSYWPDDFDVKILSPLAVLRIQAGALSAKTHGLLEAEVVTASSQRSVTHELQLIAPALSGERRTVLTVIHAINEPYPATLEAAIFEPDADHYDTEREWRPEASTSQEFKDLVKRVLQSKQVRGVVESLLARSQESSASASA
ncbi:hypothetical protein VT84_29855 [Gemmata sp. SH-PL17]|uniref:hypothetical protein n=1 Tax=Gemmata sp. SH-PL17 TaxID=1630693 RepID=UPI00078DC17A|nr:hypothetical protein [Gemmata sp. SH-PL17]AMV28647.1 hypothetical protein VT84_29855 [Gemmata sp. SH-PL17]